MHTAYIGLGSNLGESATQVRAALAALAQLPHSRLLAQSSLYRSAPLGEAGQAEYVNAAAALETKLDPQDLMDALLSIERAAGRVRDGRKWGPRVLDLDLLHMEGQVLDTPTLRLPHPEIAQRNFVLLPLAEIAPTLEIPGLGSIAERARQAGRSGLALL